MSHLPPPRQRIPIQSQQVGAPGFLWALVCVMSAMEIVLTLSEAGWIGGSNWRPPAFAIGAFWQPIFSGATEPLYPGQQFLMFVTYVFLHGSLMHLVLNSAILLSLGKLAASRIGTARTLLVLFLSTVAGGLFFGLISGTSTPMIGASGAVFGLIGLWQAWDYQLRQQRGLPLQPIYMAMLGLVAANVALAIFLRGGLAWEAHLGGWLVGWGSGRSFGRC
jgi:membrane associated rhomboid family serine protease